MKKRAIKLTVQDLISSRLQYIKFQQNGLFPDQQNSNKNHLSTHLQITDDTSAELAHDLILQFEQYGRAIRSLMLLWNHLRKNNAEKVYDLLKADKYLQYSNDELRSMLANNRPKKVLPGRLRPQITGST